MKLQRQILARVRPRARLMSNFETIFKHFFGVLTNVQEKVYPVSCGDVLTRMEYS